MKDYRLFIDELGSPNPKSKVHPVYVLMGCSMPNESRSEIRIRADQIKFKYWGHTNVSFHSREIGANSGDYSIFKDNPELKKEFISDLCSFLHKSPVTLMCTVADLDVARNNNWSVEKVLKECTTILIKHYIALLLSRRGSGRIIVESATSQQDQYFLSAFQFYLAPKALRGIDYKEIQKALTSIAFVTKKNNDIEEQISDLFAYAAKCKYNQNKNIYTPEPSSYEGKILAIFEKKLFTAQPSASESKRQLYKQIDSFCVIT